MPSVPPRVSPRASRFPVRPLPPKASLEHLKQQAKDLLDAQRRADPTALALIRARVPAFAAMSEEALAAAPFALHDAQSAIAREYGQASWAELREAVAAQASAAAADPGLSDAALRALMPLPFPPEVGGLLRAAAGNRAVAAVAAEGQLAARLPLVALRDALFVPRALGPIWVKRPASIAAIEAGVKRTPPSVAVFAQRSAEDQVVTLASLHPVGCEAYVHARLPDGEGGEWIILEGMRWIALDGLAEGPRGALEARVDAVMIDKGDAAEVAALAEPLRARTKDLASAFPDGARLVALLDAADAERLADLVIANLPAPVAEKARYASEKRLAHRLQIVRDLVERARG